MNRELLQQATKRSALTLVFAHLVGIEAHFARVRDIFLPLHDLIEIFR